LEAAKRLFMERGYEGATVRDIAAAAGLSTGAVFASFSDKADLFNAVLDADAGVQIEQMRRAAAEPGPAAERLLGLLRAGYAFHLKQLPLVKAGLSVSWSQGLGGELGDRPLRQEVTGMLAEIVRSGAPGADAQLIADTLWDCYSGGYRYAVFAGWDVEALCRRLKAQIGLLLEGRHAA
jgi:AcrR family transcriptional regulator